MKIQTIAALAAVLLGGRLCRSEPPAAAQQHVGGAASRWMKTPTVSVMTGFIYEPLKPYSIQRWMKNLGNRFDADRWVRDFKAAGASHLVFYDKWIDGLVFHDTKTTAFKTERDFVRELAAACQRARLPLVLYFNAVSDGNPEFAEWATRDKRGRPIVFSRRWPTPYQTLHSPFRAKAVEQVRELLTNYGAIHGIWHDIFRERLDTSSRWVARGYQRMYGEPFAKASASRLAEFNARTLGDYLDEVDAIRHRQKQDRCIFTANGSGGNFLQSGVWTDKVGSRLGYLFNEGHSFARNDSLARMAWVLPRPLDINLLLNRTWFTPLTDPPPPAKYTLRQAIAASAIAVCQGAGIHWALTPGHAGTFGQDLQQAKAVGAWFAKVKPYVQGARPYADVAVVVGTPSAGGPGLPGANPFWRAGGGAWAAAVAMSDALAARGVCSRMLYMSAQGGNWPETLKPFRAILVPETAPLDKAHLDKLRQYVKGGGRLIVFGHGSLLDGKNVRRRDYGLGDVLGARFAGERTLAAGANRAAVKVDSEYNAAFGAHVLAGGRGEAWASDGTPMPHWVELTLPKPVDVARIVLVNRAGPYQVADFDVEVWQDKAWKRITSVRGAATRESTVAFDPSVQGRKFRVKILRELYQGKDRQYADVGAVHLVDTKGHNWVGQSAGRIPLAFDGADVRRAFAQTPAAWAPRAVDAKPTTAETVARLGGAKSAPAILANRAGKGVAYLVTTGDGFLRTGDPFWAGLARLAAGGGTLTVKPADARRYRVILTRTADAHVLHVIDSQAAPPRDVRISLMPERLGTFRRAQHVEAGEALKLLKVGPRVELTVRPDPVATVVLK